MEYCLGVNKFEMIMLALFFQFHLNVSQENSQDASMMVLLFSKYGACSGIALDKTWILVAAHCVFKNGHKLGDEEVEIAGEGSPSGDSKSCQKVIVHDDYDEKLLVNDIALIKVEDTLVSGTAVFQSDPWPEGDEEKDCYGAEYNTKIKERKFIHERKTYEVQAKHGYRACPCINDQKCITKIVCVKGKRACNYGTGSLGGALICEGKLVGVARQIVDCRKCDPDKPKVDCQQTYIYRTYTYVCPYRDWINKYMKSEELDKSVVCSGSKVCKDCASNSSGTCIYNIFLITTAFIICKIHILL